MNSALLTPKEARAFLRIGESTEAEWRRRGLLPFLRIGRVVRYEPEALAAFVARHTRRGRAVNFPPIRGGLRKVAVL